MQSKVVPINGEIDIDAMQSRSAESVGEKCLGRMDIPMPDDLKERLTALAVINGLPAAQYVRDLLSRHVYGELHVMQRRLGRPVGDVDGKLAG